jgi:hypothetical protein
VDFRRFLSILILAIIALLVVVIWFYPSSKDFRTDNFAWNGAREFSEGFGADMLLSLDDLPENPADCVLITIPYVGFSAADLASLDSFISNGGTLLLADDYGNGNQVLEYLRINGSFSGEQLLDPLFNYKNSFFPKIIDFTDAAISESVASIVLNHATSLDIGAGVEIIARSSASSFLDLNDNQILDDGEPIGPLPVAAKAEYNRGLVFMLSDPSTIINCMSDIGDNYAFIDNITRYNGPEPSIMLDQSHLPSDNLYQSKSGLITIRNALATPAGVTLIVTIVIILTLLPIWLRAKGGKHDRKDGNKWRSGKDTR